MFLKVPIFSLYRHLSRRCRHWGFEEMFFERWSHSSEQRGHVNKRNIVPSISCFHNFEKVFTMRKQTYSRSLSTKIRQSFFFAVINIFLQTLTNLTKLLTNLTLLQLLKLLKQNMHKNVRSSATRSYTRMWKIQILSDAISHESHAFARRYNGDL